MSPGSCCEAAADAISAATATAAAMRGVRPMLLEILDMVSSYGEMREGRPLAGRNRRRRSRTFRGPQASRPRGMVRVNGRSAGQRPAVHREARIGHSSVDLRRPARVAWIESSDAGRARGPRSTAKRGSVTPQWTAGVPPASRATRTTPPESTRAPPPRFARHLPGLASLRRRGGQRPAVHREARIGHSSRSTVAFSRGPPRGTPRRGTRQASGRC